MKIRRWRRGYIIGIILGVAFLLVLRTQSMSRPWIPRTVLCNPYSEWERGPAQKILDGNDILNRRDDLTIVTGYLNLGTFRKGFIWNKFSPHTYLNWGQVFQDIDNPVVAFFETDDDIARFRRVRSLFPCNMTRIYKVNRTSLWSFSLRDRIDQIYSSPNYPKHHPNTVLSDYSCVMHAKYDFVENVTKENPFNTKYVSWLDLGYFRGLPYNSGAFSLHIPPMFDPSKISYGRVSRFDKRLRTAKEVVERNLVWIGGGIFIGTMDLMKKWTQSYKHFTEKMLQLGWMSTDQQVLYTMHLPQYIHESRQGVKLQVYNAMYRYGDWFTLGYLSKEGLKRKAKTSTKWRHQ